MKYDCSESKPSRSTIEELESYVPADHGLSGGNAQARSALKKAGQEALNPTHSW
jgi:hypothetical protein